MERQLEEARKQIAELKKKLSAHGIKISESKSSGRSQTVYLTDAERPGALINAYKSLGLTSKEARIAARVEAEVTEDEPLKAAFKLLGLSESEAGLAASYRR